MLAARTARRLLRGIVASSLAGFLAFLLLAAPGCRFLFEEPYLRIDKSTPVYQKAAEIFRSSPVVTERLGQPLREEDLVGHRLSEPGSEYAQFTVWVAGPKGKGKIHAVANVVSQAWFFSHLSLVPEGSAERISLLPPPPRETLPLRGHGTVYLIPLGKPLSYTSASLQEYLQRRFGLEVAMLPWLALDSSVDDEEQPGAGAVVAEKLIERMLKAYPQLAEDPLAFPIGITEKQMAIRTLGWTSAFTWRSKGRFAVISTHLMVPQSRMEASNPEVLESRLRKMLVKDVGVLYYKLPLSGDPTSVLFISPAGNAATLDLMTEEFLGAKGAWRPASVNDPCITITVYSNLQSMWADDCNHDPPTDTRAQQFMNSTALGLFVQKQTDFYAEELLPFSLVRMYRPRDDKSRAFGIGATHSLDVFLVGDMPRLMWVDLILEDGGRIHFRRTSPGQGSSNAVFGTSSDYTPYAEATLKWINRRWELYRRDGWTFVFPASQGATRGQQAALVGAFHSDGRAFQFNRDARGNLLSVVAPGGYTLRFEYDSGERVRRIVDSRGREVTYKYDGGGRLIRVQDSDGRTVGYSYDPKSQMITAEIPAGRVYLKNKYDDQGWLERLALTDGRVFEYVYTRKDDEVEAIDFIDPDGFRMKIRSSGGYSASLPEPPKAKPARKPASR